MEFRKIQSEDYNNCAKNLVSAYKGPPWYNDWSEKEALLRIEATMSGFNSRGYVIEENHKIIAMCIGRIDYYFSDMSQFCIDEFHVVPEFQNNGIGKNLMNSVSNSLKLSGIYKIFLITGGEPAAKFYTKNGFIKTNEGIMMELEL
ncbi:GNAT family N-acetyltransferase [Staphylococcus parequorum]|uniref:GNAT family N-acetyltransferase n=1 Tax=unclassified Staphylococcus TaxID=91994 RepID=UPI003367EBD8